MAVIVFIIPVTALALALLWVRLDRRPAKQPDPLQQVESYRKAVQALSAQTTASRR